MAGGTDPTHNQKRPGHAQNATGAGHERIGLMPSRILVAAAIVLMLLGALALCMT